MMIPSHIMRDFILIYEMHGPPYPFIHILSVNNKIQYSNYLHANFGIL